MKYKKVVISEFGRPEVLKVVEDRELPEPGKGKVRIKVLATSAVFTDTLIRKGKYPGVRNKPPFSPGYDMVGIVDKPGDGVYTFAPGQMVADLTVTGAYSEYILRPESRLVPVPDGLDAAESVSLVLSYVAAYQMLHRNARVQKDQSILVHGAGGAVGTALLQLGKLTDLKMYGTASQGKHELIKAERAIPIDYKNEDFKSVVLKETGDGVDAVFDPIGGDNLKRSFRCLKPGGILVGYGFYNAGSGKGGNVAMDILKPVIWNILPNGKTARFYRIKHNKHFKEDLSELFNLLAQKKIKPVIEKRMPLEDASRAHKLIESAAVKGRIVLIPSH